MPHLARPRRRPVHRRTIAAASLVAAVSTLLAATPALAQSTGRSVMSRQQADGSMEVMSFAVPDRSELAAPELRPADVPEVIRRLELSEAQAAVVRDRIVAYVAALEAIPLDVPEPGRSLLEDDTGGAGDAASAGARMDAAVREAMAAHGFDPARLEGDLTVGIGVSMGMGTAEDGGAEPRVDVTVSIGPGEGRSLPADERERLEQVAADAAARIEAITREQALADVGLTEAGGDPTGDRWARLAAAARDMRASVRAYRRAREAERRRLDADVQAVLSAAQLERWPAFDRWVRRHHSLGWGRLAGESLDVFAMLDELVAARPEAAARLEPLRADLEQRVDLALARRNDAALEAVMAIDEAVAARDADAVRREAERLARLHERVRDANLAAVQAAAAVLADLPAEPDPFDAAGHDAAPARGDDAPAGDDAAPAVGGGDAGASAAVPLGAAARADTSPRDLGAAFDRAARRRAFPMVWSDTPAQRAFDAVDGLPLDADRRVAAAAMAAAYAAEHASASRRIESIVLRHEPFRIRAGVNALLEELGAAPFEPPAAPPAPRRDDDADARPGPRIRLTPEGAVSHALERRLALDVRTMRSLYGMLDEATRAELPPIPEVADLGAVEGQAGDPFVDPADGS